MPQAKIGRPKGSKNKKTLLREQAAALAAANAGPLDFLISVMRSPEADPKLRVAAATVAAKYTHALPGKAQEDPKLIEHERSSRPYTDADARRLEELHPSRQPHQWRQSPDAQGKARVERDRGASSDMGAGAPRTSETAS
jgi:hypothetical protein